MKVTLATPITALPRVGKVLTRRLHKLGLHTVEDMLMHYPFRYDDYSTVSDIALLKPSTNATVRATINLLANKRSFRRRMFITEALISDETASIQAVWFNQPFIPRVLHQGDTVYFSGKVEQTPYGLQFTSPSYEKAKKEQTHTARIVPVYSVTENLTEKQLRYLVKLVLPLAKNIPEWLPDHILKTHSLVALPRALHEIHFPTNLRMLEKARQRLKFGELFLIQLKTQDIRQALHSLRAPAIQFHEQLTKRFVSALPFTLTANQKKVAWQILRSIEKTQPMNRLLEGDVGSGKTVIAALVMLNVAANRYQSALMAPTEILALQHYKTINTLLKQADIPIALLTRTEKRFRGEKTTEKKILTAISNGAAKIVIGTHALIQDMVTFSQLGLVTIDEQHRFGVDQRRILKQKSPELTPHLLSMTATPIPRSLALTLYGDLDLSLLKEMPHGRKPIITKIVPPEKRERAYGFIRDEVGRGRQVFVICPLIEESDKLGVRAATAEYEKLQRNVFPDLSVGLLHGKLKAQEKERVMNAFKAHDIHILVATAVVEVGIDVPNASVMMVEGAERFGLAQLHQFRGRVGRAEHQSYCLVFTDSTSEKTTERLHALVTAKNGFELAEMDLDLRGPGEIYGIAQSGFPELKIAKLTDLDLIQKTREAAESIFSVDPTLDHYPMLKKQLTAFSQELHLE
ncbi:MAG: ATP-dependent DNA helicase RecG [Patescibacteria group bacterium]|nr:ATP-dependent DNA helicase RecG [Patescibacteria group bacterium]MDD5715460.1 ATP-dependent DNA helicase RecG [Patescibacteria group bacterium]